MTSAIGVALHNGMSSAKLRSDTSAVAEDLRLDMGPLGEDIGFQIHITRRAIWADLRSSRRTKGSRKPSGYISTLLLVGNNPGVSPSQIAQALVIDMPNIVLIMRLLEEEKLIERKVNPADRRRLSLSLTPAGQARYVEVMQMSEAHSRKIGSQLTDEERAKLIELLGKVRASVMASVEKNDS